MALNNAKSPKVILNMNGEKLNPSQESTLSNMGWALPTRIVMFRQERPAILDLGKSLEHPDGGLSYCTNIMLGDPSTRVRGVYISGRASRLCPARCGTHVFILTIDGCMLYPSLIFCVVLGGLLMGDCIWPYSTEYAA